MLPLTEENWVAARPRCDPGGRRPGARRFCGSTTRTIPQAQRLRWTSSRARPPSRRKYDVAIMHDACYTEVAFDGYRPPSFLEVVWRERRRRRVPLAVQDVQHDRLAAGHGRRER